MVPIRADFAPPYAYFPGGERYRRYDRIVEMIRRPAPGRSQLVGMLRMLRDSFNTEAADRPSNCSAAGPATTRDVESARAAASRLGRR